MVIKLSELQNAAKVILVQCMGVKEDEKVLILTDDIKTDIGKIIHLEAKKICKADLIIIKPRKINGEEPPANIAHKMKLYDVVIMPLSKSLSHTKARKEATGLGVRIASMPMITEEMMVRVMHTNYFKIRERTKKLGEELRNKCQVKITTSLGTNIIMSIKNKIIHGLNGGIFHEKGMWGNLPEGEACLAPVEHTTNGTFIVDKSFAGIGKLTRPLTIHVKDGYANKVEGPDSDKFWKMFQKLPKTALNIAELGIGTNDRAKITGIVLEDEKVMGTCHIAIGNNMSFEGTHDVPIHVDGVIDKPTIYVDDKIIIKDGNFLF